MTKKSKELPAIVDKFKVLFTELKGIIDDLHKLPEPTKTFALAFMNSLAQAIQKECEPN